MGSLPLPRFLGANQYALLKLAWACISMRLLLLVEGASAWQALGRQPAWQC